jgi:aryl-alcohol dehydrogenase-like predicted oxidoreductase
MACDWNQVELGRSGVRSSPLGIASSFGIGGEHLRHAFERGINYFYFGSYRRPVFARGLADLCRTDRERLVVVVQSYTRVASLMRRSIESGLRKLGTEYADFLLLGWWNEPPPARILDAARALREAGLCRHLMISCHTRLAVEKLAAIADIDAVMVRYNAAHPGAETEVFPVLGESPPAVIAYTATRWGDLLDPALMPQGEPVLRASDCYRFALSSPSVQVCLAGLKNREQLDEALTALDRGALSPEERERILRIGAHVKAVRTHAGAVSLADRLMGAQTS